MAEKPLRHPDGSLEVSIKSFEQLKSRGNKITWAALGSKWNRAPGQSAMGEIVIEK